MLRYRPRVGGISRVCSPRRTAACVQTPRGISWTASSCVWRSPRGRSRHHVHTCCHRSGSSRRRNCRHAYAPPWTVPSRALFGGDRIEGGPARLDVLAAAVRAGDLLRGSLIILGLDMGGTSPGAAHYEAASRDL